MPVKLLTSGGGGVNLVPSGSIASDQTMYLPTSGTSGGTVLCIDSTGGTANGVLYLNGSKVATSGSALTFDGSKLGVTGGISATKVGEALTLASPTTSDVYIAFKQNGSQVGDIGYDNRVTNCLSIFNLLDGPLVFGTNGYSKMTLDSSGNLLVGTTSVTSPNPGFGFSVGSNAQLTIGHDTGSAGGQYYIPFKYNGSLIGGITQNGTTAVTYNTTSDHRLKTNVRDADARSFKNIKFRDFEWIDGRHDCGVIAHELQEVYPDLVLGEKDAVEIREIEISPAVKDDEGNVIAEAVVEQKEMPVYQQVNYIGLICRMGTVIQQQSQTIESLTQRIEALEYTKQGE